MRTAITLGKLHAGGKWTLISGLDVPILDQRMSFRELLGKGVDSKYSEIAYQESDGNIRVLRFETQEQLDKRLAAEKEFAEKLEAKKVASDKKSAEDLAKLKAAFAKQVQEHVAKNQPHELPSQQQNPASKIKQIVTKK